MKIDDSGMPEQSYWDSLFDVEAILNWMACLDKPEKIIEIGCGYGTFSIPVATQTNGSLIAYDIEQSMLDITRAHAEKSGLGNIAHELRDVLTEGTGLEENSVDRVMLFNILHFSERHRLLLEAARILKPGGQVDVLHWRKDIPTPRGPEVNTRPDSTLIQQAIEGTGLQVKTEGQILPPYHWGIQLVLAPSLE